MTDLIRFKENRFNDFTNHLLNEFLVSRTNREIVDGEARTRLYVFLKASNNLHLMMERNGELDLQNEWVNKLLEDFITAHENSYGGMDYENVVEVYGCLKKSGKLYELHEGHYSYDEKILL